MVPKTSCEKVVRGRENLYTPTTELIGYCHLIQKEVPTYLSNAAKIFHYNNKVFTAPP